MSGLLLALKTGMKVEGSPLRSTFFVNGRGLAF